MTFTQQASEPTLNRLIYSEINARDILQSREIPFWHVDEVVVEDPRRIEVTIRYSIQETVCQFRVPGTEFLKLAWGDRLHRSNEYQAAPQAPNLISIVSWARPESQYQVQSQADGKISCTCPDYANQLTLLPEHPALWHLIKEQPRCKHLLAAAPALRRFDLLMMPTVETLMGTYSRRAIPINAPESDEPDEPVAPMPEFHRQ